MEKLFMVHSERLQFCRWQMRALMYAEMVRQKSSMGDKVRAYGDCRISHFHSDFVGDEKHKNVRPT